MSSDTPLPLPLKCFFTDLDPIYSLFISVMSTSNLDRWGMYIVHRYKSRKILYVLCWDNWKGGRIPAPDKIPAKIRWKAWDYHILGGIGKHNLYNDKDVTRHILQLKYMDV